MAHDESNPSPALKGNTVSKELKTSTQIPVMQSIYWKPQKGWLETQGKDKETTSSSSN